MRNVYFDPFGSYTQGYDKGLSRQMELEQNVRAARDSDYNYNVLKPYELNSIKREDAFGNATLNDRIQNFRDLAGITGDQYFKSRVGIANDAAVLTGATNPVVDEYARRYNWNVSPGMAPTTPAPTMQPNYNLPQTTVPQIQVQSKPVPGQVFWDAWSRLDTSSQTPANAERIANHVANHYGVPMDTMQGQILAHRPGVAIAAQAAPQNTQIAPQVTPQMAPQAAPYNLPPQTPMQGSPTVIRDASGQIVSVVPDLRGQVLTQALRPQTLEDRAFQQANINMYYNQLMQQEELRQKYDYDEALRQQTAASRAAGAAGAPTWNMTDGP